MCGRYRRNTSEEELARLYHIPIPKQTDLPISYNIAPSQRVLTIRFNPQTQRRSLDALQWGLIQLHWRRGHVKSQSHSAPRQKGRGAVRRAVVQKMVESLGGRLEAFENDFQAH